jgi:hypothetical protein
MPDDRPSVPDDDDEVIDQLSVAMAEIDPVPDIVRLAARAAYLTRDLDGELAVLISDSAPRADETVGQFERVRGAAEESSRVLSFAGGGVEIDLEITRRRGRLDLVGQILGAAAGNCALEYPVADADELDVDELGRFAISRDIAGAFRVRCRSADGSPVRTVWVTS